MNKIRLILFITVFLLLQSGCAGEIDEIEQLAFVSTLGIDKNPDGEGVLLSVRITSISTGKQDGGEVSSDYYIIKAKGETFYQAMKNLQTNSQQKIFFGHNKAIVFGKEFAEHNIVNAIDAMERNIEISRSKSIFISELSAVDTINMTLDKDKGSKTDFVGAMIDEIKNDSIVAPILLYEFTLELKSDNKVSYAPVISFNEKDSSKIEQNASSNQAESVNLEKTAIIKDNKLLTILPKQETTSLLWMKNQIKDETLVIPYQMDDGTKDLLTIEIKNGKTKIKPELDKNGLLTVKVNCKGEAYLREVSYGRADLQEEEALGKIEQLINKQLKTNLENSISYAKNSVNCDYFGIAHTVHNQLPDYWKEVHDQWDAIFQVTPFLITFDVELKDVGMINEPGAAIIDKGATK